MARGWESKSVAAQIDVAENHHHRAPKQKPLSPDRLEQIRKKETLLLSHTRILHELETSENPRYRVVLEKALADLDTQLSHIASA
jgi:DNA-binding transcriptional regulator YiaG